MQRDGFDKVMGLLLVGVLGALTVLLINGWAASPGDEAGAAVDRALEREMAYRARTALLEDLYGPVEDLQHRGRLQAALLKLEELERRYPGEAHGKILKGEILYEAGALREAVASFVAGVKRNGDYIDPHSPLSRRAAIRQVVDEALDVFGSPSNADSGKASLRGVHYLQSRLAGGCE